MSTLELNSHPMMPLKNAWSHRKLLLLVLGIDVIIIGIAATLNNPHTHFAEAGFVTCFSFYQLLVMAVLAREIFMLQKDPAKARFWEQPSAIWLVMAFGFLYLSVDELVMIHERLDGLIHTAFQIEETGLTDRIDDVLIGLYGLIGIAGLYLYRDELEKYKKALPYFTAGFIGLFMMVGLDILTNRDDIIPLFVSNASLSYNLDYWINIAEDMLKVFAEGIFIGSLYYCYRITRNNQNQMGQI